MEKLLRLLNIYSQDLLETNLRFTYDGNHLRVQWDEIWPYVAESIVINKKFWFIERLVKNDEINFKTFGNAFWTKYLEYPIWSDNYDEVSSYKDIIKWLAISDTPIEDLISYLKE